ncbi:hypothetical protein [Paratractidigestivibacter sp.]|uniref:hypothetical protein n=1 Tax=Paratractidigestivibacter sp. TaxID=2847316 RepID=UPI002ABDFE95|nr:hypothetical protein [Paratractidigestivibacter sp.]
MSSTNAKKGIGLYLDVVAMVLAVAGIIAMVVSTTMGEGYEFAGLGMCIALAVVAIALVVVAIYTDMQGVEKGPGLVALFALGVAIFLMVYVGVQVVSSRALSISGLFSWNSMDTTGWSMFYAAVASAGCFLVGAILLVVGCFLPIAKKAEA